MPGWDVHQLRQFTATPPGLGMPNGRHALLGGAPPGQQVDEGWRWYEVAAARPDELDRKVVLLSADFRAANQPLIGGRGLGVLVVQGAVVEPGDGDGWG
jgi:hypothetical protein